MIIEQEPLPTIYDQTIPPLLTTALLTHEVGGFVIDATEEDASFPTFQLMEWDLSFLHFILQRL